MKIRQICYNNKPYFNKKAKKLKGKQNKQKTVQQR